jgi:hypothetical protein
VVFIEEMLREAGTTPANQRLRLAMHLLYATGLHVDRGAMRRRRRFFCCGDRRRASCRTRTRAGNCQGAAILIAAGADRSGE